MSKSNYLTIAALALATLVVASRSRSPCPTG